MSFPSLAQRKKLVLDILKDIKSKSEGMPKTMGQIIAQEYGHNPFFVLISTFLSARARDIVTLKIVQQLFAIAKTPREFLEIPIGKLEKIIHPIGFYKVKARRIHEISKFLLENFNGKVPNNLDDLLTIPGVGRKTANLVLSEAFGIPAIVVDTHVQRLTNLFKLVRTKKPIETEKEIEKILPKKYWIEFNRLFVAWGQNTSRGKKSTAISGLSVSIPDC